MLKKPLGQGENQTLKMGALNVINVMIGQCKVLWIKSIFHVMQFLLIRTRIQTKIKYVMYILWP